jgi:hypothetical protein
MNSELLNLIMNPTQGPGEPVTYSVPVEEVRPGDIVATPAGPVFVLNTEAGDALGPWITVECLNTGAPRWLRCVTGEYADVTRHA